MQSAGLGIPKRSHTVLVTDATSTMLPIISDTGGRSKGSGCGRFWPAAKVFGYAQNSEQECACKSWLSLRFRAACHSLTSNRSIC
jgi:hypothetical protein